MDVAPAEEAPGREEGEELPPAEEEEGALPIDEDVRKDDRGRPFGDDEGEARAPIVPQKCASAEERGGERRGEGGEGREEGRGRDEGRGARSEGRGARGEGRGKRRGGGWRFARRPLFVAPLSFRSALV